MLYWLLFPWEWEHTPLLSNAENITVMIEQGSVFLENHKLIEKMGFRSLTWFPSQPHLISTFETLAKRLNPWFLIYQIRIDKC